MKRNSDLALRIQQRLKELNLSSAEVSRRAGMSADFLRNIFDGRVISPRSVTLEKLARVLEVDPVYLMTGRDKMVSESQFALVRRYDISVSAGMGSYVAEEELIDTLAFNRGWLKREGLEPENLSIVTVTGDSMEPVLKEGDLVLVHHNETEIKDGKLYVFRIEDRIYIKWLQNLPNQAFLVSSANKYYDPYTIKPEDFEPDEARFEIIGRVISSMNRW